MTPATLRRHLVDFLSEVAPVAERIGIRLCCHPDDPPWPLLGLPRVMSTEADYRAVLDAVDLPANGATLCTGSLGARPDNDVPGMATRLADRIHFAHLRNVIREGAGDARRRGAGGARRGADDGAGLAGARQEDALAGPDRVAGSFFEAEHLGGDIDMVAVVAALVDEERRRTAAGRVDRQIPMRPDHGQHLCSDLDRPAQPGYPIVGRLRGLAELRGVMCAVEHAAGWRLPAAD
jgi:mannonate dehydratase